MLSEEDAFWVFVQLMETDYFTLDYFQQLIGAQVDSIVMTELLKEAHPELMEHLAKYGFEPSQLITF